MPARFQVTFDANDVPLVADFWAAALGYEVPPPPDGFDSWDAWAIAAEIPEERWDDARALEDPAGESPRVFIQKVPEGKTAKNRMHLDINTSGGRDVAIDERRRVIDAESQRLADMGGTIVGPMEEHDVYWIVMQDPEGNEFCIH